MTRHVYPDYHRTMLDAATHPGADRKVKCDETRQSLFYRTGTQVYKIRKTSPTYNTLAVKEALIREAFKLGQRWAPELYQDVIPICAQDGVFTLGGAGTPVDYALRMAQVSTHYFVNELVERGKFNDAAVGRVARFLALHHAENAAEDAQAAEAGRPETFAALVEEVLYQTKKYIGSTLTSAMYELISRPLAHFMDHHRKEFTRRVKAKRLTRVHGAFIPEHVYIKGKQIEAVAARESPHKMRVLDAASDVAQFINGLTRLGAGASVEVFLKRYIAATKDRDLPNILPAYAVFHAAREGLIHSEWLGEGAPGEEEQARLRARAELEYARAVDVAHTLPK